MCKTRLIKHLQFIYGMLEGHTVYFMDRKQDLRPAQSTVWKASQKTSGGTSYVFPLCFTVLLRQLQRLYASGSIFQVPLVYNYSTCCTGRVLMRLIHRVRVYAFGVPTCLCVWCTSKTLASQRRGALVYRPYSLP